MYNQHDLQILPIFAKVEICRYCLNIRQDIINFVSAII